jgi:glycerate dehydrogenase
MNEQTRNVVFLDTGTLPPSIKLPSFSFPVELTGYPKSAPQEVSDRIRDADIVITNKVPIARHDIERASNLKLIAVAATGTNVIDLAAAREQGVTVSNIRDYATHTVPEHTFALILALRRNLHSYRQSVVDGRWQQAGQFCYFDYPIADLAGTTLGVIGGGALGSAVARLGRAFGMTVLSAGRKGEAHPAEGKAAFIDVLEQSDVLTLHVPLLPDTKDLIGAPEFALMRRKPLVINTSRGGLVNEKALHHALVSGQIAGAGFDVVSTEPPPSDHIMMKLLEQPNFLLTPHVAWASEQAIQTLVDQLAENIELYVSGSPRNVVV